jgi:hypothetical protein
MDTTNLPLSEQYRLVAKRWVELNAAASIREESKSAYLSRKMTEMGDMPVSKAEMLVKGSQEWQEYLDEMVIARRDALEKKVQLEYIRMKFSEVQSEEATKRAEMKL